LRHAHTDSLTGLGNHRAYELELSAALERAELERAPLSLCFVDVDDFKQINDSYGHHTGDDALREVALRLGAGWARAFRLGGDEFALLLECDSDAAVRYVEAVVEDVRSAALAHGGSVTLSAGIGVYPDHTRDGEMLERIVDSALYWSKQHGKKRVFVFD